MRSVLMKLVYGLIYSAPVALLTLAACGGGGGGTGGVIEYQVGGTISGLTSGGLVLQNNQADDLIVPAGSAVFSFPKKLAVNAPYNVSVLTQPSTPSRQNCAVTAGATGVMPASNVAGIVVDCVNVFGLSVEVYNLTQDVVLQNVYSLSAENYGQNYTDDMPVSAVGLTHTKTYEFGTLLPDSTSYSVTAPTPTNGQSCSFNIASSVGAAEVHGTISTDVAVQLRCL